MSVIASAKVQVLAESWKGEVTSGTHQFLTDKPESFGGHDTGLTRKTSQCM